MEQRGLFSQEALAKMRSPERLNTLLKITSPLGWMALAAVLLLLTAVVVWSFLGAFTVKAEGFGLILDIGGVENITHISSGRVRELYVRKGSVVKKGDLLALIGNPSQIADTVMAHNEVALSGSYAEAQSRAAHFNAARYQEKVGSDVRSPYNGIVDEVVVSEGSNISAGSLICTVRRTYEENEALKGVLYISVEKAKRVETGMVVQLQPNASDESKTGSLVAVVRSVSQYPVNQEGIKDQLGNQYMAQWIPQKLQGPVVEVKFDLVRDGGNESGYLWTSIVGKKRPVTPGTFVTGSVVIERKPPIERVFYRLTDWLSDR